MKHDTFQAEINYYTLRGVKVNVIEEDNNRWLEDEHGYHLYTIIYDDQQTFNVMKMFKVGVEFFPDRVEAMAYDGTTPVSVYYADKGRLSNGEVCNLAILYAATRKLEEDGR